MAVKIKKSREGTLTRIAKREGGIRKDGKISKTWARKKLKDPRTRTSTKRKIVFYLNFNR